ncbi:TraB domain containing 2A [Phyllostomus discolor]|uniref:Metalloprotease TIKI n=1 Tax=Phyllostomus discolor TaxID=89673 RepID=A0A834A8E5_9CHIR|nr:TraB domain containing 2A [Phyllostomus discolor]
MWTIKRDPPSYFFGTIRVPYTRVWDFIPDSSKEAFQQSSIVYFELDLTDPYTISALTSCQMLPQGKNLQDVLPRDIYCRLKHHLEYVKVMMPSWMAPDQHDLYLAQEAEWLRKQTGVVEEIEEQCHPLNGLNFSQVIFALNQTLLQQESLRAGSLHVPYTTEDLIKQYNCGDLSSVIFRHDSSQVPNFTNATLPPQERITAQEIDSYFRQELINKWNEKMGKRVKALLEEFPDKGFFFAFGAGHFMGNNNTVLEVLRCEGYEVEHVPAGRPINKERSKSPSSPPISPAIFAPEVPALEASVPETVSAVHSLLPPHVSLPGSTNLLGQAKRKFRKKRRRPQRRQQLRQFRDVWVGLEESAVVPQLRVPDLDRHISAELQSPQPGLSHRRQMVASSASWSLWTPVFWVLVLAFQTETPLLQ